MSLVEKKGIWSAAQAEAAKAVEEQVAAENLGVVRLVFADQHGILRGKTVTAAALSGAMRSGVGFSSTMMLKDTSNQTVRQVFDRAGAGDKEFFGAPDLLMIPDPTTFKVLPWAPHSGWMLCDVYSKSGIRSPLCARNICKSAENKLADIGFDIITGLEFELHIFKLEEGGLTAEHASQPGAPGMPPKIQLLTQGYQYLTEARYDLLDPVFEKLRANLEQLGLNVRTFEVEFGPSQIELTFAPDHGTKVADDAVLFRSAVKQICHRHGYHATFMCRPNLPNIMSSGWHLHQSLQDRKTGKNVFSVDAGETLSSVAKAYLAGLLEHASGATAFTTPTINGYKRYRPYSLAPDRIAWGYDNRGAMIRAVGFEERESARFENRVGESAANPYLYIASQILSGLDGISRKLEPPPAADTPYEADAKELPRTLGDALHCLESDAYLCDSFGKSFIDVFVAIKRAELSRYNMTVSDWEHREYFDLF